MATPPDLLQTALEMRSQLDTLITSLQSPTPPPTLPDTKRSVLDKSLLLSRILQLPFGSFLDIHNTNLDKAAIGMLVRHRWFDHFPCTTKVLEEKSGILEEVVMRCLKTLGTLDIVFEREDEETGELVWDLGWNGVGVRIESIYNLSAMINLSYPYAFDGLVEYFDKYPRGREKSMEGVIWMQNGKTVWEMMQEDKELEVRFLRAMEGFAMADRTTPRLVSTWLLENAESGKVIDVGGGAGYTMSEVCGIIQAESSKENGRKKEFTFEIQDLFDGAFKQFVSTGIIPKERLEHLTFLHHNFFTPQPASSISTPISAIFLRYILHDWTDADSILILRQLIPILESNPKSAILINDHVLPEKTGEEGFLKHEEREVRRMDLNMMVYANAKERMRSQWEKVLRGADERLVIEEVVWEGGLKGANCVPVIVVRLRV